MLDGQFPHMIVRNPAPCEGPHVERARENVRQHARQGVRELFVEEQAHRD